MPFDLAVFVDECQIGAEAADPAAAVCELVSDVICDGPSIDAALGTDFDPILDTLFVADHLTIQRIRWSPGMRSGRHEHRMWAVVGVYDGCEVNRLYERTPNGLAERERRDVQKHDVLILDEDVIHSVENPLRAWTSAIHVYGGDILNAERSAWLPDDSEVPFPDSRAEMVPMFVAMREYIAKHELHPTNDQQYTAMTAVQLACQQERRFLTDAETQRIVAQTLGPNG